MKMIRWLTVAAVLAAFSASAVTDEWQAAIGPLKTPWAKDVSPRNVWKEYPRPQMARKDWLNLNGLWDYTIIETNVPDAIFVSGREFLVPFPVESALLEWARCGGWMRNSHLVYRRTFKLPKKWNGRHVLLHFGAVDWETKVFINGAEAGSHIGGYDPFTFDITAALKPGEAQEIMVDVFDPTDTGGQPRGKQIHNPNGIWYTPTSGIWQTVWLEPVPETSLDGLLITPDLDHNTLRLSAQVRSGSGDETAEAVAFEDGKEVGRSSGRAGVGTANSHSAAETLVAGTSVLI